MKRLVTFCIDENGKKRVQSISAPIAETDIDLELDTNVYGLIDAVYVDPLPIEGKKMILYYNSDTQLIETEYTDIGYEDLSPQEKIEFLKEENANLKAELELTQMALFELDWMINGGGEELPEEEIPEDNLEEIIPENPEIEETPVTPETPSDITEEIPNENIQPENPTVPEGDSETIPEVPEETPSVEPEIEPITDLQKAIDDAESGATITLTNDIYLTEELSTNKTIIIDLNGHNITSEKNVLYIRSENANVTFIGEGNVRAGSGASYICLRAAKGVINIEGGTYFVGPDETGAGNSCIYASGSGAIYINGGEFSTDAPWDGKYYVLNKKDKSDSILEVTGGKFHNFNPADNASEGTGTNFVVDGYEAYIETIDENNYITTIIPSIVETEGESESSEA